MKEHLDEKAPYLLAQKGQPSEEADVVAMTEEASEEVSPPMEKKACYMML